MPNTTNHLGNTDNHQSELCPYTHYFNNVMTKMMSTENSEKTEPLFLCYRCEWHSYSTKQHGIGSQLRVIIGSTVFSFDTHPQRSEVSDWLLYTMHTASLFRM